MVDVLERTIAVLDDVEVTQMWVGCKPVHLPTRGTYKDYTKDHYNHQDDCAVVLLMELFE